MNLILKKKEKMIPTFQGTRNFMTGFSTSSPYDKFQGGCQLVENMHINLTGMYLSSHSGGPKYMKIYKFKGDLISTSIIWATDPKNLI